MQLSPKGKTHQSSDETSTIFSFKHPMSISFSSLRRAFTFYVLFYLVNIIKSYKKNDLRENKKSDTAEKSNG